MEKGLGLHMSMAILTDFVPSCHCIRQWERQYSCVTRMDTQTLVCTQRYTNFGRL